MLQKLINLEVTDSTNRYAKQLVSDAKSPEDLRQLHGTVVSARRQTGGRGRLGRSFYSPADSGVYFSLIFVPEDGVKDCSVYTAAAAVCVCRAIEKVYSKQAGIKWVNDIYMNGKKVCGILAEGMVNEQGAVGAVVTGVGINLRVDDALPVELREKVGGIESSGDVPVKAEDFLQVAAGELIDCLEKGEDVYEEYRKHIFIMGKRIEVTPVIGDSSKNYEATVVDVTPDFRLSVKKDDGTVVSLGSGEVTLRI